MRTAEIQVFRLEELLEKVQERVISRWRDNDLFFWSKEWEDSLNGFASEMGLKVTDWEVNPYGHSYVRWEDIEGDKDRPFRPGDYSVDLSGNCPFTGYIGDESILDGIRAAKEGDTLREVVDECFWGWVKGYLSDLEYWYSEECVREEIEANEAEFTTDGRIFRS